MRYTIHAAVAAISAGLGAHAAGDEIVWSTLENADPTYEIGPSVWFPPDVDQRMADDFFHEGDVTRVFWKGESAVHFETYGAFVRFYERTEAGEVGALLYEEFIDYDQYGDVDVVLPTPFEATGWHYVSVQVHNNNGFWNPNRSNQGAPVGQSVQWKDNNGDATWGPYMGEQGNDPPFNVDVAFQLWGTPAETITIGGISGASLDRSERIVVNGLGFGSGEESALLIDGHPAITTDWSPTQIIGYVPEEASLGDVEVIVQTPSGQSAPVMLEVLPRVQEGNVRWRFALDSDYTLHNPGIGPNGEVYHNDLYGRVYALTSDGGLMWITDALQGQTGLSSEGPVVVGEDGTIYVGVNPLGPTVQLVALSPEGEILWTHTDPDAKSIGCGPGIGPNGDVYIVYEGGGTNLGIVRLDPQGNVIWTNLGDPFIFEDGGVGAQLAFAPSAIGAETIDQVAFTVDSVGDRRIYGFDLETGDQRFAAPGGVKDAQGQSEMHVAGGGRLVMPEFNGLGGNGWGLQSFDPANGDRLWRFDPGIASYMSNPGVGPDGSTYFAWDGLRVSRVSPEGEEIWRHVGAVSHRRAVPTPDGSQIIVTAHDTDAASGVVKSLDAETGEGTLLVQFEPENGLSQIVGSQVAFTDDGATALVATSIAGDVFETSYSFVYAIAVASVCESDVNGDGSLDILDFVAFQNQFVNGDPAADCNDDDELNILDFVCFQTLFEAGCP